MSHDIDPVVARALERHTPDAPERPDWAGVTRAARAGRGRRLARRWRWLPAAVGAVGLAALIGALVVATPGDGDRAPESPPAASATASSVLSVFVRDDATVAELDGLRALLVSMQAEGRISSFSYVSADEALARLRARLRDPSVLDELPANPMPASFTLEVALGADREALIDALAAAPATDPRLGVAEGSG